jgi:iron complex outermembrane receptor protein
MRTYPISDIAAGVTGPMDLAARSDLALSPRVSARWLSDAALSFKANAGLYFRPPTVLELFGDRGFVVGNPSLRPERGASVDAGLVYAPAQPFGRGTISVDRVYVEVALFGSHPFDAIAIVPNAGLVTGARNLGAAWIGGAEAAGSLRVARFATVTANYTWLESRQSSAIASFDGKALPQRPRHQAYVRADVAGRARGHLVAIWGDVTLVSANFLDPANLEVVPSRQFVGAGVKLELRRGVLLGAEGKNLADARIEYIELDPAPRPDLVRVPRAVADFLGYPLPGRAFYATLDLEI